MEKISCKAFQPFLGLALLLITVSCQKNITKPSALPEDVTAKSVAPKNLKDFEQVNLVGDNDEYNPQHIDANFINGWGIAFPANGPAWISAEGTGMSLVLNGVGVPARAPVAVPGAGSSTVGHPTGMVFNGGTDFKLPNGNPARFIFAGADGVISGWNSGNAAIKKVNDSPDAGYFGIAIATDGGNNFLYAANFAEGKIDVYDKTWTEVNNKPFIDPDLPPDYSPFNIANIDSKLYVMYAKVGPGGDEIHHEGFGLVDIFNSDGSFVKRFISNGQLNSPWGIAKAPAGFWGDGSTIQEVILVGNFGDGRINAYDSEGVFLGQLRSHGNPIVIDGLWGISFAPSTSAAINHNWLYFAAGPDDEEHGLFGYIAK